MTRSNALTMMSVITALSGLLWWGIGSYGVIFAACLGLLTTFRVTGFRPRRKTLEFDLQANAIDKAVGLDTAKDPAPDTGPWRWKAVCAAYYLALIVAGFALAARFPPERGVAAIGAEIGISLQGKHF